MFVQNKVILTAAVLDNLLLYQEVVGNINSIPHTYADSCTPTFSHQIHTLTHSLSHTYTHLAIPPPNQITDRHQNVTAHGEKLIFLLHFIEHYIRGGEMTGGQNWFVR